MVKYFLETADKNVALIQLNCIQGKGGPNTMALLGLVGDLLQAINELSQRIDVLENKE